MSEVESTSQGDRGLGRGAPIEFVEWYRNQHPRLIATMLLTTGDLSLATEVVGEAFARALERWGRVSAMASPTGWTFRVARNLGRRAWRRSAMERRLLARTRPVTEIPAPAGELWHLVAKMPQRQREVIVLRYVADLPDADIASALGISRSTVSTTVRDAQARLAEELDESTTEGESHA